MQLRPVPPLVRYFTVDAPAVSPVRVTVKKATAPVGCRQHQVERLVPLVAVVAGNLHAHRLRGFALAS